MNASPIDPEPVDEYFSVTRPPTSIPKSKTSWEPFPESLEFPGYLENTSPELERMLAGDTVLEDGAYMFACHGPGNAVSAGPLHDVFFQHCRAIT